jgi:hypothetical protein
LAMSMVGIQLGKSLPNNVRNARAAGNGSREINLNRVDALRHGVR